MTDLKEKIRANVSSIQTPTAESNGTGGFFISSNRSDRASATPREAAVLVACVDAIEPHLILTVRSHQMPHHAGQVSLPGGRPNDTESFPIDTALREAHEEIGLERSGVEILGVMPTIDTLTGFRITPVVAWVTKACELVPCDREVQAIFDLPLAHVLDPANHCCHQLHFSAGRVGSQRIWSVRGTHWPIWGATAQILAMLAKVSGSEPRG